MIMFYSLSSPFLCVFGDDRVTRYREHIILQVMLSTSSIGVRDNFEDIEF